MVADEGKTQREHILRQQMRTIKEELGEGGDDDEVEELRERLRRAELPDEVHEGRARSSSRASRGMQQQSAEYNVTRTYLEWLADLPWSKTTPDKLDVEDVRRCLDEDHFGLEKVKKRIIEYIAVRKLRADKKGPILCFIGPPGVGKTSLGQVDRAVDGAALPPHRARRRARRGGDPRAPAHVRGRAARAHHPGAEEGRR